MRQNTYNTPLVKKLYKNKFLAKQERKRNYDPSVVHHRNVVELIARNEAMKHEQQRRDDIARTAEQQRRQSRLEEKQADMAEALRFKEACEQAEAINGKIAQDLNALAEYVTQTAPNGQPTLVRKRMLDSVVRSRLP